MGAVVVVVVVVLLVVLEVAVLALVLLGPVSTVKASKSVLLHLNLHNHSKMKSIPGSCQLTLKTSL